jgi:hypothetical protein
MSRRISRCPVTGQRGIMICYTPARMGKMPKRKPAAQPAPPKAKDVRKGWGWLAGSLVGSGPLASHALALKAPTYPTEWYARQSGYRAPSQSTRSSGPISPRRVIQNDTVAEGAGHPAARGPSHARWRIDHWNVLFHAGSPTLVPHFNRQMFLSSLKPRNTGEHVRTGKVLELMITVVLLRARPRKIFCQHDHCCPIEPRFRRFSS